MISQDFFLAGHLQALEHWHLIDKDEQDVFLSTFILRILQQEATHPEAKSGEDASFENAAYLLRQETTNLLEAYQLIKEEFVNVEKSSQLVSDDFGVMRTYVALSKVIARMQYLYPKLCKTIPFCADFFTIAFRFHNLTEVDGYKLHFTEIAYEHVLAGIENCNRIGQTLSIGISLDYIGKISHNLKKRTLIIGFQENL